MTAAIRGALLSACAAVLGIVCLGLAAPAQAWDEPLWVRTFGTGLDDGGLGIAADGKGNVYTAGTSRSVECGGECSRPARLAGEAGRFGRAEVAAPNR